MIDIWIYETQCNIINRYIEYKNLSFLRDYYYDVVQKNIKYDTNINIKIHNISTLLLSGYEKRNRQPEMRNASEKLIETIEKSPLVSNKPFESQKTRKKRKEKEREEYKKMR